ncbi:RHS repeat-associated core domain-containing protein [Microbacterium sp. NPDC087665]|uniref:RHS repeat-associated core domain-containing protein n=1 Tax=Microbacterium sp. NPDC087665 TaxID=3364194 RepID=UPI00382340D0
MWSRTVAISAIATLVLGVGAVAPAPMTPGQLMEAARDDVLQRVYAAAGLNADGELDDSEPTEEPAAPQTPATGPVTNPAPVAPPAQGGLASKIVTSASALSDLAPGEPAEVSSDSLGVQAQFSGHELKAPVSLSLTEAPAEAQARRSAVVDTSGVVVSDPVEIVALDAAGEKVTSFPAELIDLPSDDPEHGPTVKDVIPGITLEFDVDMQRVKDSEVATSTLRIYTRSTPEDPWTELPSYFDAETQTVKGESDHLSQFVVIGTPFPVPPGPVVVLDPDNDEGIVQTPAPATEFPYNWQLVQGLKSYLELQCNAQVVLTNPTGTPFVSRGVRAGRAAAANPVATVGFGFATWQGHGWGTESEGGTMAYSRGSAADNSLRDSFVTHMPTYTGRPANVEPSNANFPFTQFVGLPGAYAHIETLFLDHNYDRPVIDQGFGSIIDGTFRSLGGYLEGIGFDCTDPVLGGWPSPPSQAELARWRQLGYQNYQTYGADPVSFSTGNLVESFPLFDLAGPGAQSIAANLVYNAQDGRLSRVGAGWSFGLGARAQRFDDDSVMIVRGDGASFVFASDGAGGYTGEEGLGLTLTEAGAGQLNLASDDGETWVFDAADVWGIGELARHVDRQGNATTLTYGPADRNVHQFVPLTSITDAAGQTVAVTSDGVGRITGFTLPDGRTWSLAYNDAGDLMSITSADGSVQSFTYDAEHRMLAAVDENGVTYLVNEYDDAGRVVRQLDAESNVRTFEYADGETTYTDNEGGVAVFEYDDKSRITGIVDTAGEKATWEFDDLGNVESHTDEAGRTWEYTYDDDGNLLTETDPSGAVTTYTYTADGDVETVTDLDGDRTETNVYNDQGLISEVLQADGTTVRFEYNAAGDLTRSILPSGAATTYAYDARGNLTSSTDALGRVTTFGYDGSNRLTQVTDPAGGVSSFAWDAGDRLASSTDAEGGVTTYAYDAAGQLTAATDAMGGVTAYSWDALARLVTVIDPEGGQSTFAYDGEDNLVATADPEGGTTAFVLDEAYRTVGVIDPNGGEWERQYDETGVPTASIDPLGAETAYAFDDLGRPTTTTDATGVSSTVTYDSAGRMVSQTDSAGGVTKYTYDLMDRVTLVTDPAGFKTEHLYDIDGKLIGVVDRNGNPTLYEVDAAGQVLRETDATGAVTEFEYDPAGRITSILDADGRTTAIEYDRNGQQTAIVAPGGARTAYAYDKVGRLVTQTDALGAVTTYAYDAASRLVTATDAEGGVSTYAYDKAGRQTRATDPVGEATAFAYDKAGQLVEVTEGFEPGEPSSSDTNVKTAYAYTANGLLSSITNPLAAQTTFAYDAAGRQTTETGPTGIATNTSYDAAGRVERVSNPAGLVAAYTYDARSDIAKLTRGDGQVSFEYSGEQQPIVMDDPTGTTGWVYDEVGRLLEQTDTRGNTLTSTYTAAGLRESLTYPDGTTTAYTFDEAGDVVTQSTPEGDVGYTWDAESRLTGITRPNQVTSTIDYDALGQVTRVRHETPEVAAAPAVEPEAVVPLKTDAVECRAVGTYLSERSTPTAGDPEPCVKTWDYLKRRTLPEVESPVPAGASLEYTYEYDAAGSVTDSVRTIEGPEIDVPVDGPDAPETPSVPEQPSVPEPVEGPTTETLSHAYSYDNLGRLTRSEASDGETNTYGYDSAGNRTSWDVTGSPAGDSQLTAQFNAAGQLTGTTTTGANAGSASYSFDGAGNRSSQTVNGQSTSFGHDAAGRLLSTQADGRSTSYAYDGLDRRASVTDETRFGSDTTGTVWDGFDPVATDSGLHGVTDLLRDPLGGVVFQDGAYEDEWVLGDMRNATATADAGGQITDLVDYADFGGADYESTGWGSLVGNDGQPGDATLGLDHYYARDYDTVTGSWVQPDEWRGLLVRPQSLNRFAYVENSPVAFSDYLGYLPIGGGLKGGVAKANAKSAMKKGGIAAAVAKTNASVPPHSFGKGAPSGAVKPRDRVITPQNRSPFFTAQLHLLNLRGCGFGDIACRGTRLASTSSCFLMPNPASCIFSEMDRGVRTGIQSVLNSIGAGIGWFVQESMPTIRWVRNLPLSIVGGFVGGTAVLFGGRCDGFERGLLLCSGAPWRGTITLGNVITTNELRDDFMNDKGLAQHEVSHTMQSAIVGNDVYTLVWLGGLVTSILTNNNQSGGGGCLNPIEQTAAPGGGYEELCHW